MYKVKLNTKSGLKFLDKSQHYVSQLADIYIEALMH